MGLGPLHTIGLADARERAGAARKLRLDGVDPLGSARPSGKPGGGGRPRNHIRMAAEVYHAQRAGWRNAKHAAQWEAPLQRTCIR